MALELLRFLFGAALVLAPGVMLAEALHLGTTRLARWTHGSTLGLAAAIYLASAIGHFDLNWFYPLWLALAMVSLTVFLMSRRTGGENSLIDRWMLPVLLIVAASRYALTFGRIVPEGVDPPVFLLLAKKIQVTHHAISDWRPFATAPLTYPTGGHALVAVLSSLSGLPLHTVFKNLIPLLGVLMTAQVYVFARRVTQNARAGLYAAAAYGWWAGDGSINFFGWGGLPNELALLLFLAMLSANLEHAPRLVRWAAASVLYAAVILVHHHTLLASGGVILALVLWMWPAPATRPAAALLALSVLAAAALDLFFLLPYAAKAATLSSTNVFHSEWRLNLWYSLENTGLPFVLTAAAGIALCARGRWARLHPAALVACAALLVMFIACEYVLPIWLSPHWRFQSTVFSPSHFLNDIVCFLAVFAGAAVAVVQDKLNLSTRAVLPAMMAVAASRLDSWRAMAAKTDLSPDYVRACQWIEINTPPATVFLADDNWGLYFAWRRSPWFQLPDS
jgi:hypothetical protein